MSGAYNIPSDIDTIILSVPHNGRASDDMTYLRDLVAAGMRAAAPPVDAVPGEPVAWMQSKATDEPCVAGAERLTMTAAWKRKLLSEGYPPSTDFANSHDVPLFAASVASRAGSEPVELDEVAIEQALSALDSIARKQRQVADTIEPIRTINDAAKLAGCAHARLHQALVVRDYKREKEGRVLAAIAPAAALYVRESELRRFQTQASELTVEWSLPVSKRPEGRLPLYVIAPGEAQS